MFMQVVHILSDVGQLTTSACEGIVIAIGVILTWFLSLHIRKNGTLPFVLLNVSILDLKRSFLNLTDLLRLIFMNLVTFGLNIGLRSFINRHLLQLILNFFGLNHHIRLNLHFTFLNWFIFDFKSAFSLLELGVSWVCLFILECLMWLGIFIDCFFGSFKAFGEDCISFFLSLLLADFALLRGRQFFEFFFCLSFR